jgi:integrase
LEVADGKHLLTRKNLLGEVLPTGKKGTRPGVSKDGLRAKRMNEEAANATINRELAGIRRAFNLALEQGLIQAMPKIKALREASPRQGYFERPELGKVLWKIRPRVVRHIVLFAYYTGWRKGEILNLEWQWVDFGSGEVRLSDSKSGDDSESGGIWQTRWT